MDFRYLREMKRQGRRIVMCTAYDAAFGTIIARSAAADLLLVGDSLAMVVQGKETTREVTLDQMVYHTEMTVRGVRRGLGRSMEQAETAGLEPSGAAAEETSVESEAESGLHSPGAAAEKPGVEPGLPVIGDMPFGTYGDPDTAVASARRLIGAGAAAVKIEGSGTAVARALTEAGIPVMGHLGLLPQTAERFTVQGKDSDAAEEMKRDARALEEAGVFSLVLECIPRRLAREVSELLEIPTIGIGAGPACDGQVLVLHDMLGLTEGYLPKFVKRFAELGSTAEEGIRTYAHEVREGSFPKDSESYH
jgi:3-methyl-2-oxobutanoate hydroxymethyltransferase